MLARQAFLVVGLALADLRAARVSTLCQVFGLAAVLAPLLILFGIRNGVVAERAADLMRNPENLRITLARTAAISRETVERLAANPDVAYVGPHPIVLAVIVDMADRAPAGGFAPRVALLASGPGDPYLPPGARPPAPGETYLSAPLAGALRVRPGDQVEAQLRGRPGAEEGATLTLRVAGVLPAASWGRVGALVAPDDLFLVHDWTDGRLSEPGLDALRGTRPPRTSYPSIRLYARDIDSAFRLVETLAAEGLPAGGLLGTAEDLARLRAALDLAFALVAGVAAVGYAVAFAAQLWSAVDRRRRPLSLLRLGGLRRPAAALFPLVQSVTVAAAGWALAAGVCVAGAGLFDAVLGPAVGVPARVVRLGGMDLLLAGASCLVVAVVAPVAAAGLVLRISPEEGLRNER